MRLPAMSATERMSEPGATRRARLSSRYGSEKSITDSRSSVIVMPDAARSHWSVSSAEPVSMASKGVVMTFDSTPRSCAIRSTRSMSKPTVSPFSTYSNGA